MTSWNSDYVAAHPPIPGDIFVVTTIYGKRVAVQSVGDYERAAATARAYASKLRRPIKVLCMSLHELLAFMGISAADFAAGISPELDQELRQSAIDACYSAMRECPDPSVRADAYELLIEMGVVKRQ